MRRQKIQALIITAIVLLIASELVSQVLGVQKGFRWQVGEALVATTAAVITWWVVWKGRSSQ